MADNFKDTIEQIQSRVDIVEVVSGYIPLKKTGANFKAPCPFHHEKTPSFVVSPSKQIYHCFGCGAGGDTINFVMEYEKIDFMEALGMLAQKAGVKLPVFRKGNYRGHSSSSSSYLYRINEMAVFYYNAILLGSGRANQAREYCQQRGISADTVSKFKLGFAPDMWDGLIKYAQKKSVKQEALEKAGLVLPGKKQGSYYDRFRNRIIFPIFDVKSKPVGFGGRVIDDSMPKYVNSPETDIYIKGRHLYGLNITANEIRQKNEAILVEGYLDLIMPFQYGITNIVATLGTALTIEQINLIKRYTSNVVIIFDSDAAGEAASLRSLDILIGEGLNVKVATLPAGSDPDTYVREKSAKNLRSILDAAKGLFDYKMDILLARHGKDTAEDKAKIISEMLPTIKRMDNAVLKADYIKRISQILSVDEEAILTELKKVKLDYTVTTQKVAFKKHQVARPAEKLIAALIMEDAGIAKRINDEFDVDVFKDERIKEIVTYSFAFIRDGKKPTVRALMNHIEDEKTKQFICQMLEEAESIVDKEKTLEDCIKWLKADSLKFKKEELTRQIKEAEGAGESKQLMVLLKEFNDLRSVQI